MTCGANHIIMGVALEAFWGGAAGAAELETRLAEEAGVPVTIGSTAVREALRAFGATSIALLTPHMPAGDDEIKTYFVQSGFEVVRIRGLKCPNPRAIAQVQPAEIEKNLRELDGPDVQALVQLGTNLAGADVAVRLEPLVGKPVIAINSACYWHALRRHGIRDQIPGRGRLFTEH
jgi:maleate isomerase